MNFKNISMLVVIFIFLTLATVNASDFADNNLTADIQDVIIEEVEQEDLDQSLDDSVIADKSEDEITKDDFNVYKTYSLSSMDDDWYENQIVVSDFPKDGTLKIFVDNELKFSKNVVAKNDKCVALNVDDMKNTLGIKNSGKDYGISIKYAMENREIEIDDYRFYLYDEDSPVFVNGALGINDNGVLASLTNTISSYLAGTVEVTVDGKKVFTKKFTSSDKLKSFEIKAADIGKNFPLKDHNVKVTFKSSNGKTYSSARVVNFVNTIPSIEYFDSVSVGEKQSIVIKSAKGSSGVAVLYKAIYKSINDEDSLWIKGDKVSEVKIVNGHANFPLNQLPKGEYKYILEYDVSGYKDSKNIFIDVYDNSKGFSASVKPFEINYGDSFNVKLTGPKSSNLVYIYVDNVYKTSIKLKTGSISQKISGLSVGKHTIRVEFISGNTYFAKTFDVVVKKAKIKMTLKKVKVKKSMSKLKLTATLKINGKVAKNKKVTFKFNKKTFNVKTNKNGIAKLTVKKKFLKKLKVGKKVTYQVSYGQSVVKKSVKVKK